MKSVATALVREAKFDLPDFATAKTRDCEGFALLLSRVRADSRVGWLDVFQHGDSASMSLATSSNATQSVVSGTSQSASLASPVW